MTQNDKNLALVLQLAEQLKVKLDVNTCAISTRETPAKVRSSDGRLEAEIFNNDTVRVSTPKCPGIYIRLVDLSDASGRNAPKGAVYRVHTFKHETNEDYTLNGEIYDIYVDKDGLVLAKDQKERIKKCSR